MTRALPVLLLFVLACGIVRADENPDVEKFTDRAEATNEAVADAHVALARWCLKVGLNLHAHEQLQAALKLAPEHKKAMVELGYKRKKIDGVEQWVLDEKRAPSKTDAESVKAEDRKTFQTERAKLHREAANEYVKLAKYAEKLELKVHARVTYEMAVKYDPLNEPALEGAGWVKDELDEWISPRDAAERELTGEALSNTPLSESLTKLPDWTARAYGAETPIGMKFDDIEVITTGSDGGEVGKFAWATSRLCADLLGGGIGELRVVVAANSAEHKGYCKTRHPGMPGLSDDNWVLADKEVEVLMDADDEKMGLERVVYAVAVFEVRRRCGETTHPWFEVAFAGNMTRRLLGRVSTSEFSGEAEGPSESGRWKRTLRQLVYDDRVPKLGDVIVARNPTEHQVILAHFFVRYLCSDRAAALSAFCGAMKSSDDDESAFQTAFEQDASQLDEAFLAWFDIN